MQLPLEDIYVLGFACMELEELHLHNYLDLHKYVRVCCILWDYRWHYIAYCDICEGFAESLSQSGNWQNFHTIDNLYVRAIRSKLDKGHKKVLDKFITRIMADES